MLQLENRNTRRESWEEEKNDINQVASIWDNDKGL